MKTRVAINGFGRIGRSFVRAAYDDADIEIVAVNDLGDLANLAYLLHYDSVYGRAPFTVEVKEDKLLVGGKEITFLSVKDPATLPWRDMQVDLVIESTGVFDSYDKASPHITAGAKRVVITAPAKGEDTENGMTVLVGVNEEKLKTCVLHHQCGESSYRHFG